jgi:hypothetical protein
MAVAVPLSRCIFCHEEFNANIHLGKHGCLFHPAKHAPADSEKRYSYYPCCGLALDHERAAAQRRFVDIRREELRGCTRLDHLSEEEANNRKIVGPQRRMIPLPVRFLDDITILGNYVDESSLSGDMQLLPDPEAILVHQGRISLDVIRNPRIPQLIDVPVAWPIGAKSTRDIRKELERFVLVSYQDPAYHASIYPLQELTILARMRKGKPTVPEMNPGAPMTIEEADRYEQLWGRSARLLNETQFLSRYLMHEQSYREVPYRIVRRVAAERDPGLLAKVNAIKKLVKD